MQLVHQAAHLGEVTRRPAAPARGARPATASPTRVGSVDSSSAAAAASASTWSRARSKAASTWRRLDAGVRRPPAIRFHRALDCRLVHRTRRYRVPPDGCRRARLRPASRVDRPASGRAPGRLAAPRRGPLDAAGTPSCFAGPAGGAGGELVVVNDTRVVPARFAIERPRGEVLLLERSSDGVWEVSRGPPGGCGRARATARSSCSSTSARGAGGCVCTASRRARRRCRRTSPSRSRPGRYQTVYAASRARPRRRRRASTSRRSCSRGSTSSA